MHTTEFNPYRYMSDEELARRLQENYAQKEELARRLPEIYAQKDDDDIQLQHALAESLVKKPIPAPSPQLSKSTFQHKKELTEDEELQKVIEMSLQTIPRTPKPFEKRPSKTSPRFGEFDEGEIRKAIEESKKTVSLHHQPFAQPPVHTSHKKKKEVAEELVKTTYATSSTCSKVLEMAIEKAKKNKNIRITHFAIKQNAVNNAYLELGFANLVDRNLAVEELRSKYGMFGDEEPMRIGTQRLRFTVNQTIAFENTF